VKPRIYIFQENMEDLQSLMACLDDIANQIPDGMYLKMADQMKRVHDHMNGNKLIHEDTFYYSDDDSELESDDDSDSDFEASPPRRVLVTPIRDQLLDYVKKMHEEYKVHGNWNGGGDYPCSTWIRLL
jgi:broad specificity polyphosphatase/5'/3'-nucleotidase SurE